MITRCVCVCQKQHFWLIIWWCVWIKCAQSGGVFCSVCVSPAFLFFLDSGPNVRYCFMDESYFLFVLGPIGEKGIDVSFGCVLDDMSSWSTWRKTFGGGTSHRPVVIWYYIIVGLRS